jgi:hypothetical protein
VDLKSSVNCTNYLDPFEPVNCLTNFFDVRFASGVNHNFFAQRSGSYGKASEATNISSNVANRCAEPAKGAWLMSKLNF